MDSNHLELGGEQTPEPYLGFLQALSIFSLDFVQMVPADCLVSGSWVHYDTLVLETLAPIVIVLFILLYDGVSHIENRGGEKAGRKRLGVIIRVVLLILPAISRRICQTFQCQNYDEGDFRLLVVDPTLSCTSDVHQAYGVFAFLMLLICESMLAQASTLCCLICCFILPHRSNRRPSDVLPMAEAIQVEAVQPVGRRPGLGYRSQRGQGTTSSSNHILRTAM